MKTMMRFAIAKSSLGSVLVAATEKGICAITIGNNEKMLIDDLHERFPDGEIIKHDQEFEELVTKVIKCVERPSALMNFQLDIRGTAFQQKVWSALQKIPAGKTASYAEIAKKIGKPTAYRAVAQACGANNICVLIPCHRVVRNDGNLSGYRWGVEKKRELLRRESH